ncbi:Arc family DNA-binding protein (plasmid) [Pseudomonas sp. HR96]|uniref:Arc family DNA-binding protein n=1 Tax=Pseudomonas sp. HR96 TaxID=1027966 RepID=UPI002A754840|nr:Arc family DNA-binding protein [Pseudomonas sp. HR96]WPP02365.1 Arc family DNA-binding protein [Pseudomonas sp. HR96]
MFKRLGIPARSADKFVLRLPDNMRERIAEVAENDGHSMNWAIVSRLDRSMAQEGVSGDALIAPDKAALSLNELELLQQFRQLSPPRQDALIALIGQNQEAKREKAPAPE